MHRRPLVVVVPCLLLALTLSRSAYAQDPATTIDQLLSRVKSGDRISATDSSGKTITGKLITLSPSALIVHVDGSDRTIPSTDLRAVLHHHGDSLKNGFGWGFLGGAILVFPVLYEGDPLAIMMFTANGCIGGLVGMAIDASIKTHQLVFIQGEHAAEPKLMIAPLVARRAAGVQITLALAK